MPPTFRHREIIPRLPGSRFLGAEVLGNASALARWQLGDGCTLRLELNLSAADVSLPSPAAHAQLLYASRPVVAGSGQLPAFTALMYLEN